jgi:hypothetical protein
MKNFRSILTALAFFLAIAGAFASTLNVNNGSTALVSGYWKSPGCVATTQTCTGTANDCVVSSKIVYKLSSCTDPFKMN